MTAKKLQIMKATAKLEKEIKAELENAARLDAVAMSRDVKAEGGSGWDESSALQVPAVYVDLDNKVHTTNDSCRPTEHSRIHAKQGKSVTDTGASADAGAAAAPIAAIDPTTGLPYAMSHTNKQGSSAQGHVNAELSKKIGGDISAELRARREKRVRGNID
jgi:hypothetical protein